MPSMKWFKHISEAARGGCDEDKEKCLGKGY